MFDVQDGHGDYYLLIEKTSFSSKYGGPLLLLVIGAFLPLLTTMSTGLKVKMFSASVIICFGVCVCVCVCVCVWLGYGYWRKEEHVLFNVWKCLFNNALNTFYLRLYGVRHMVKNHLDSKRENSLPPHGLLSLISSKGSFICIIPHAG